MRIDRVKFCTELAKKDMKLYELANKCGVSRQTLSYVKNGKSCSEKVGMKIAKGLEVTIDELI